MPPPSQWPTSLTFMIEREDDGGWADHYMVKQMAQDGYDLVAVESIGDQFRFVFHVQPGGAPSPWRYEVCEERGLQVEMQEMVLNTSVIRGMELVAAALATGDRIRYYCRSILDENANYLEPAWLNRVVTRPVGSPLSIISSLDSERDNGWVYKDHAIVPRDFPSGEPCAYVFLQRRIATPRHLGPV